MPAGQVTVEDDISRPLASVWEKVEAFCDIADWHPLIAHSSRETEPGPEGGIVRTLTTRDGGVIREELLACDTTTRSVRYAIITSPFPVTFYRAKIQVIENRTPGSCRIHWTAEFEPQDQKDSDRLRALFRDDVFKAGIRALDEDS